MGRLIDADDAIKAIENLPLAKPGFDSVVKLDKAFDDGYKQGYLQAESDLSISQPHENDLVFRRDAIEAIIRETNQDGAYGYGDTKSLVNVLDALPSAQPEPLRINLNEWVKVKLTDLGKEIYYHQYDNINKAYGMEIIKPSFPNEDENGYARFQLWEFIMLYGEYIEIDKSNVIDPLEIVYEGEN